MLELRKINEIFQLDLFVQRVFWLAEVSEALNAFKLCPNASTLKYSVRLNSRMDFDNILTKLVLIRTSKHSYALDMLTV